MTSKKTVEEFFAQPALAVVGVSRSGKKFGNYAYRNLKDKGYKVYQIHPESKSIDGDECYPDFKSAPDKIEVVHLHGSHQMYEIHNNQNYLMLQYLFLRDD